MRFSAIAIVLYAAAVHCAGAALADTLIDNVDGFTLDRNARIERFSGLLIGDDGRIVQVLQRGDKRPGNVDYLLDGQARVLMPGLIDSHINLIELGFSYLTLDLSTARSLSDAQSRIAAYAAAHPDRAWILGRGWDQAGWASGKAPTAADLDQATGGRPAWLVSADGHSGWANTAAMTAAGLAATTRDPPGGRIERATAGGKPTGILVETAMALVENSVPSPRPEDRDLALAAAQEAIVKQGITAVSDMGTTIEDWQSYRRAGDAGTLRIRIMAYAAGTEDMSLIGGPGPSPWLYDDRLRLNGVALSLDGTLASRGAWLKSPYADAAGATGLPRMDETRLRNLLSRAAIDRFQVAIEANGDAAGGAVLDAVQELAGTYTGDRRWRIEGLQAFQAADLQRFSATGSIASVQPAGLVPALAERRLGPARSGDAFRWASFASAEVQTVLGSGAPAAALSPLGIFALVTTRQDASGLPSGGWQGQERLTREAALAAFTAGAAYAGFAEGRFGRLSVGQRADFILLDRDPLIAGSGELQAVQVLETWIGGRRAWAAARPNVK
ncbi:MAG: amidohydrolase [Pseudomonadota bacterium]